VSSPDLGCDDARWPAFAARAQVVGVSSVHAVPMVVGDSTIGALNLFRYRPGPVDESELAIAASFASAATVAVLHLRDRRATHQLADQLQHALSSRIVIEQAKGYLAKLHDEPPHAAFQRLRSHARRHRQPLTTVARLVIEGQLSVT
jgi:GAF domain-containing protein